MGQALRFLGLNPTEPQIREMIIEQNTPKGKLTYKQFVDSLETVKLKYNIFNAISTTQYVLCTYKDYHLSTKFTVY